MALLSPPSSFSGVVGADAPHARRGAVGPASACGLITGAVRVDRPRPPEVNPSVGALRHGGELGLYQPPWFAAEGGESMPLIMLITALVRRIKQRWRAEAQRAALAERARIARDLHDVLAHSLAAVSVNLQAAEG